MLEATLLKSHPYGTVTVVGKFATWSGLDIDLTKPRDITSRTLISRLNAVSDDFSQKFFDFIGYTVYESENCFEYETEYEKALASPNPDVRALVAMNGKLLDKTVKDDADKVRIMTIRHFIEKKKSGEDCDYDTSILDCLVNDKSMFVLSHLAMLHEERHLDILVNNEHSLVRAQCAAYSPTDKYFEQLSQDEQSQVRGEVALRGAYSLMLATDESVNVRLNVAIGGSVEDINKTNLSEDANYGVRWHLADRGIALEQLIHDNRDCVREIAQERMAERLASEEYA